MRHKNWIKCWLDRDMMNARGILLLTKHWIQFNFRTNQNIFLNQMRKNLYEDKKNVFPLIDIRFLPDRSTPRYKRCSETIAVIWVPQPTQKHAAAVAWCRFKQVAGYWISFWFCCIATENCSTHLCISVWLCFNFQILFGCVLSLSAAVRFIHARDSGWIKVSKVLSIRYCCYCWIVFSGNGIHFVFLSSPSLMYTCSRGNIFGKAIKSRVYGQFCTKHTSNNFTWIKIPYSKIWIHRAASFWFHLRIFGRIKLFRYCFINFYSTFSCILVTENFKTDLNSTQFTENVRNRRKDWAAERGGTTEQME